MPNTKTYFIAGALVGASVNFAIQSAEMAMDYDRQFDWGEFFVCPSAGVFSRLLATFSNQKPSTTAGSIPSLSPTLPGHLLVTVGNRW